MAASTPTLTTQAAVAYVIALAAKHAPSCDNGSADVALADARACYDRGDMRYAYHRARTSLAHSVGLFHPAFQEVASMHSGLDPDLGWGGPGAVVTVLSGDR